MIDLERVKEKAENIINFYLDSNWEFRFILTNLIILQHIRKQGYYLFNNSWMLLSHFPVFPRSYSGHPVEEFAERSLVGEMETVRNLGYAQF